MRSSTIWPAVAVVEYAPTPWGRVATGANVSDTATFAVYPVNRRR